MSSPNETILSTCIRCTQQKVHVSRQREITYIASLWANLVSIRKPNRFQVIFYSANITWKWIPLPQNYFLPLALTHHHKHHLGFFFFFPEHRISSWMQELKNILKHSHIVYSLEKYYFSQTKNLARGKEKRRLKQNISK